MRRSRTTLLWLVAAVGLVAAACVPPPEPDGNATPIAVISAEPTSGTTPLKVTFSAAGSDDPDGTIVEYRWDFGDGTPVVVDTAGDDVQHTYTEGGTFTATLTVRDDGGKTQSATTEITATTANDPPVAVIGAEPTYGKAPLDVQFTGSGSFDPDGTIESYEWDFGDGTGSTEADPSHLFTT